MIRSLFLAIIVISCSPYPALGASPRAEAELDKWLENLSHPDPFISKRAEAEVRNLGEDALLPLAEILAKVPEKDALPQRLQWLRVDRIVREILADFLSHLESEYSALELDRQELELLSTRLASLARLKELRGRLADRKTTRPSIETDLKSWLSWKRLRESAAAAGGKKAALPEAERAHLEKLAADVERLKKELPDFEQVGGEYRELQKLESIAQSLESKSELTRLRAEDLRERTRSRKPRVDALTGKIRILGTPALVELAARRELLPVREAPPAGELSATCERFYEILLAKGLDKLSAEGRLRGDGSEEGDYGRGILWALEVDRKGKDAAGAAVRLEKHVAAVMRDLDSGESLIRDRARLELYRLGERGLAALVETREGETVLKKKTHGFLHGLLRWRINPEVYSLVGIQFNDYSALPFAARRRKIFQYARAAGGNAIPTLRAIVSRDALEPSFLVKYAAARALMTQLSDRWGFLFLQASNPEFVLKRPEISRDLLLLQGLSFVRSREYQSAAREFRKIIEEFPFDFEGHYHLGFSYLLLKNYTQAIHHFEVARRINPKDELTLYNLACACSLAGRLEKALEALDASVEAGFKDPDHLENDRDLDPLRKLDGYKRILEKCNAGE